VTNSPIPLRLAIQVRPLLPGWAEMPTPEGTYYYSEESGTSTWDRPEAPY